MNEALTFSEALNKLMQDRQYTLGKIASIVGSRADLRRVLEDDATAFIRNRLFEKLKESNLFDEAEYALLYQGLEISRFGAARYRFHKAIEGVLKGESLKEGNLIPDISTDTGNSLHNIVDDLSNAEQIDIICYNSCFSSLARALQPLFADKSRVIHMRHYVHTSAAYSLSAEYVESFLSILFDPRYVSYIRSTSIEMQMPCISGNLLFFRAIIKEKVIERCFAFASDQLAYEMPNAAATGAFSFVNKIVQNIKPRPVPVKEEYPHEIDFPSLCMVFLSHELNRATYAITNDLCFQQTPTDIAVAAFIDKGITSDDESQKIIERTISIHEQRYQNLYQKKKNTYRIMTYKGCQDFLDTGKSAEHFVGFRVFTPQERKTIFGNMIRAAKENAYFIPLILKDHHFYHRYNLVCYEKLGVSIDVKDTDYDISNGYRSVFLMHPSFTKQFMDYYMEILVGEKSYSRQQSLQLLEEMYENFLEKHGLKDDSAQ